MGRPRKKDRMSRMVQARVTDEQYDYLSERAYDTYDGDMSAALRASITFAGYFDEALNAADPGEYIRNLKEKWEQASFDHRTEMRMDQPDDEVADEN
jgi:hypothetical protein